MSYLSKYIALEDYPGRVRLKVGIRPRPITAMILTRDNINLVMAWCNGKPGYVRERWYIPQPFTEDESLAVAMGEVIVHPLYGQYVKYTQEEFFKQFELVD